MRKFQDMKFRRVESVIARSEGQGLQAEGALLDADVQGEHFFL